MASTSHLTQGTDGTRNDVNTTTEVMNSDAQTQLLEEQFKSLQLTVSLVCERAVASMRALEVEASALRAENERLQQRPDEGAAQMFPSKPTSTPELPGEIHEEVFPLRATADVSHDVLHLPSAQDREITQECPESPALVSPPRAAADANENLLQLPGVARQSTVRKNPKASYMFMSQSLESATVSRVAESSRVSRLGQSSSPVDYVKTILGNFWTAESAPTDRELDQSGNRHAVFADVDNLKAKVRAQMCKTEYDVRNLYKTSGWCQQVARSSLFENVTMALIAVNAVWIGIESDHNPEAVLSESLAIFQVAAHLFCTYFAIEWLIRFSSFARKPQSLTDAWFVFDTILVLLTVGETWGVTFYFAVAGRSSSEDSSLQNAGTLRLLRLLRLTRMGRIFRLLRVVPEIMTIIRGVTVAARSVFFTLMLLVIIIYVFAICFAQLTKGLAVGDAYFSTVPHSMETLLLYGTFLENIPDLFDACVTESVLSVIFLLVYILVATVTLMNTLIGVLCEVISVVSAVEKEGMVTNQLRGYLERMWADCGIYIKDHTMLSKNDVELLINHPQCAKCLNKLEVDVVGLVHFADNIFSGESARVSFIDFVELVLTLRGTNTARVKDIMDLRLLVSQLEHKAEDRHRFIKSTVQDMEKMLYPMAVTIHPDLRKTLKRPTGLKEGALASKTKSHVRMLE